ncbi:RDD family protein [Gelidibacter sp.]|uniref:RDD family protein n=1 Tax=Gelidibacter sp. TaxID=2018083 RepID=UPI00326527F2
MKVQNIIITEEMLASKNKRFLNYLIDIITQYVIMFVLGFASVYIGDYLGYYEMGQFFTELSTIEDLTISYLLLLLYYFTFESLTFRSLGKYATNTKVIMQNGEEPTPKDILIRTLCRLIPFDGLSFLGVKGKGWHDSFSKTYVVDIAKFEAGQLLATEIDQIGQWTE